MPEIGDTFLRYKIISLIGSGGMGEVYLARDIQLDRNVAVKVLKPKLSHRHGDALERFILEARSASALNHPNIITIYEIGEFEGSHYIASEFVEGQTLHERVNRKSLALPEILNISIQTAEALSAAHSAGIVHRDIKPENIVVRSDGYVKVLDFGLAKLTELEMDLADVEADTRRMVATNPGVVMGTVSYMSPEQARGKTVDKRTDIWSLGVVMYEMVAGQRPFTGETTSDVIAAILRSEPEALSSRSFDVPHDLERIIGKALRKDREERYQHIKDLLIDLKDLKRELDLRMRSETASFGLTADANPAIATGGGERGPASTAAAGLGTSSISEMFVAQFRLHPILLTAIAITAIVVVAAAVWVVTRSVGDRPVSGFEAMRFSKLTSIGKVESGQVAVSPDGKYFAFAAREPNGQSLWVRQSAVSGGVPVIAPGNLEFDGLTFSPDGNYLYFTARDKTEAAGSLYQIPTFGGERRKILSGVEGPISFAPNGTDFVFVRDRSNLMIGSENGNARLLATSDEGDSWQTAVWSPDGETIVGSMYSPKDNYVHLVVVAGTDGSKRLLDPSRWLRISGLAWLRNNSGILISGRDPDTQMSQIWLLSYPGGQVTRITNDLSSYQGLSVTADGRSIVTVQETRLANIWVASGSDLSDLDQVTAETGRDEGLSGIAWTPDGEILYTTRSLALQDLWIVDPNGSNNRRLTFDARSNFSPAVSPDGRTVIFISTRTGSPEIWRMNLDGTDPKQLSADKRIELQPVVTGDGKWIVYQLEEGNDRSTIWKLPIDGGEALRMSDSMSERPVVSPDGKLIAFRYEPDGGPPTIATISVDGGDRKVAGLPNVAAARYFRWSADGSALLYVEYKDGMSRLMSQSISGGPAKKLMEFKDKRIFAFDVSRTGRDVALSLGSELSEAVMINNFQQ